MSTSDEKPKERVGDTYIVTWVTDNGDHYHGVYASFEEFLEESREEGMEGYYRQVHVFRISAPLSCPYTLWEHPCWEEGCEVP